METPSNNQTTETKAFLYKQLQETKLSSFKTGNIVHSILRKLYF